MLMSEDQAEEAFRLGMTSLQCFNALALQSVREGRRAWVVKPKTHRMVHLLRAVKQTRRRLSCLHLMLPSLLLLLLLLGAFVVTVAAVVWRGAMFCFDLLPWRGVVWCEFCNAARGMVWMRLQLQVLPWVHG